MSSGQPETAAAKHIVYLIRRAAEKTGKFNGFIAEPGGAENRLFKIFLRNIPYTVKLKTVIHSTTPLIKAF